MRRTESGEQETVIEYCGYRGIEIVHIPNEGKRSARYGAELKRLGMRKGFPDLFLPKARKGFYGLFIELKRDVRSKPTKEQLNWIGKLNAEGYLATVCYGAEAAICEIENYFKETDYPKGKK